MLSADKIVAAGSVTQISELKMIDGRQTCTLQISVSIYRCLVVGIRDLTVTVYDAQAENCAVYLKEKRSVAVEALQLVVDGQSARGTASAVLFIGVESRASCTVLRGRSVRA